MNSQSKYPLLSDCYTPLINPHIAPVGWYGRTVPRLTCLPRKPCCVKAFVRSLPSIRPWVTPFRSPIHRLLVTVKAIAHNTKWRSPCEFAVFLLSSCFLFLIANSKTMMAYFPLSWHSQRSVLYLHQRWYHHLESGLFTYPCGRVVPFSLSFLYFVSQSGSRSDEFQ